jgi:hypothetical protein
LFLRVREIDLRPQKFEELKSALNTTENFLQATRLLMSKKDEEDKPFTDSELNAVEKIIRDTYVNE